MVNEAPSYTGEALTLSVDEAAPRFPCSTRWLTEQLRAGRLPGRKIGRNWRLTEEDIREGLGRLLADSARGGDDRGLVSRRRSA